MPGDLHSPEQSVPYYYDRKYEPGTNPFEPGMDSLEKYIQTIALEKNIMLKKDRMEDLMVYLSNKGLLCRNFGDESFRNEIFKYLDRIRKARRVVSRWLISMN